VKAQIRSSYKGHTVDALAHEGRRRTWQAAKSYGEPQAGFDP